MSPKPASRPALQVAILSRLEAASPVFQHLFPEIFTEFDRIILFEDLIDAQHSGFPVNLVLGAHHRLLAEVEQADRVISTLYRGAPYYLLDNFTGQLDLCAFHLLGLEHSLGAVLADSDIALLELEEQIIAAHHDRILFRNPAMATYLAHRFGPGPDTPGNPIHPAAAFPVDPTAQPFLRLPGISEPDPTEPAPKNPELGPLLSPADYVSWAETGQPPATLTGLDLMRYVLLDQGNDHLGLGKALLAQNAIGGVLLALDQKRPAQIAYPGQIPAYNDPDYLHQLRAAHSGGGFTRYPGFGDVAPFVSSVAPQAGEVTESIAVSVIITHFNRPALLAACLRGFQAQTMQDFEIIVVDNNSDADKTPALPDMPQLPGLSLLANLNTYPGYARNLGAQVARGEYVLFFDDDNIPNPDLLEKMLAAIRAKRQANGQISCPDLVSCFRQTFIGTPKSTNGNGTSHGEVILSAPDLVETSQLRNFMGDVVFLMRRDRFAHLQFSDYFRVGREDFEILYQARRQGLKVHVIPEALYLYRLDNGDKIGHRHLTHRPGGHGSLDFGAFRKFRRASAGLSAARILQLLETYHVAAANNRPRRFAGLKRLLRQMPMVRRAYYRWFR